MSETEILGFEGAGVQAKTQSILGRLGIRVT